MARNIIGGCAIVQTGGSHPDRPGLLTIESVNGRTIVTINDGAFTFYFPPGVIYLVASMLATAAESEIAPVPVTAADLKTCDKHAVSYLKFYNECPLCTAEKADN